MPIDHPRSTPWPSPADLLAPPACVLCGRPGGHLCAGCAASLSEPRQGAGTDELPGLEGLVSLCAYEGTGKDLVLAVKRRNRRGALGVLAAALAAALCEHTVGISPTCVTWPPTTAARRRTRGFDQAELLARRVASELGVPCLRLLVRRSGDLQGASRPERLAGVEFRARSHAAGHVVLVDDVVTTGATMCAAADVLRSAGATAVTAVSLARA